MGTVHWPVHKSKQAVEKGCVGPHQLLPSGLPRGDQGPCGMSRPVSGPTGMRTLVWPFLMILS